MTADCQPLLEIHIHYYKELWLCWEMNKYLNRQWMYYWNLCSKMRGVNTILYETTYFYVLRAMKWRQSSARVYQVRCPHLYATASYSLILYIDNDEETAKLLAKLFSTYGETYTDYIAKELDDPNIQSLMSMIMRLTEFEGYFPADQEVSEIPLNFWYILQETLHDESVLPPPKDNPKLWSCAQSAIVMYRELVVILIKNARYPDDETWNSWNKGLKKK